MPKPAAGLAVLAILVSSLTGFAPSVAAQAADLSHVAVGRRLGPSPPRLGACSTPASRCGKQAAASRTSRSVSISSTTAKSSGLIGG